MAKKFVKISLATKFRVLYGAAVLGIIAAALVVPWYFMELLAERGVEQPAAELTQTLLNEYLQNHIKNPKEGFKGISFTSLAPGKGSEDLDSFGKRAKKLFERAGDENFAVVPAEDKTGRKIYRCFRAVRIEQTCVNCHMREGLQSQPGQMTGMIDLAVPVSRASGSLMWWTRGAFLVGAALAALLAFFLFVIITQRLILRPVRQLRDIADKVAEGDLAVRSPIRTGDELERLGESFNEMLEAINDQHEKLRAANRALDLKLNELAEANVTLYHANQVKSEFLTNVSHELRTPLNSIIGFADLLGEDDDQRVRRYGQNISGAAKSLLGMINDLLDLAKIEAGKAELQIDKVSVTDTCQSLATLMKPVADKRQLEMRLELTEQLPLISTDAGKLQQILHNLISNAIKFTPAGGRVTISAGKSSVHREGREIEEVTVAVADTGPGIAEADQKHIFEKFYQVDRTLTKESSGTGLGLAIAKELTNLLGGRLSLKSLPGRGAEFALHLPIEGPQARGKK
ncbi:MAG: sensor histidine kinase [Planctomycetota bacterium]|jgi:signal transduction histidine kinase